MPWPQGAQPIVTPSNTPAPEAEAPPSSSLMQGFGQGALDLGKGIVKGGLNTIRGLGNLETKIPGVKSMMPADAQTYLGPEGEKMNATHGTMQGIGKGIEQAGEFMIPGGAEERLAAMAPKAIRPLAKVATSALGSGLVNKAQGGEFGTGALAGAGGSAVGQGLRAAAPAIAEKALGIRGRFDRAFNKTPGVAALEETSSIRPERIAQQAGQRIGELSGQVEGLANQASERPNPVRGLLTAPKQEIPLHESLSPRNPRMRPMGFPAQVNPEEPMVPRSGNPMAPISEYPGINPHYLSGSEHPELSGRIPTQQGVLIRPAPAQQGGIAATVPNRMASMRPGREPLEQAMGEARRQNAGTLHGQLGNMREFLGSRFDTGEAIPEQVTPREMLDLRRGFNEEHGRWNPDIHEPAVAASRRAYGGLTGEFHRVLPEAEPLDTRISNLIPVKNRAQITALGDNPLQKGLGRIAAHTGAATGGIIGGQQGYREGGIKGGIAGAGLGILLPELISSPAGQMALARTMYKANALRPLTGGLLQFDRNREPQK